MRAMVLAITVMSAALVPAQSKPPKSMPADVGSGRVAWFDITTTDLSKSKAFYGMLFEWTFNPLQGTDLAVEIVSGGSAIGTLPGFPFDLPNGTGAIGLVSDPAGHPVGMYSRTPIAPQNPGSK